MNTNANGKKGLTIRDLVTIGIFSALFLVFALVGGIFFAPNPVLTFYMPVGSALLCGPVYLLMLARVKKRGAASLLGALMCLVWFVTGMHWAMALGENHAGKRHRAILYRRHARRRNGLDFVRHAGGYGDRRGVQRLCRGQNAEAAV